MALLKENGRASYVQEMPQSRNVAGYEITPYTHAEGRRRTPLAQAIESLQVGESFIVPDRTASQVHGNFARFKPKRFRAQTLTSGARIWRVE